MDLIWTYHGVTMDLLLAGGSQLSYLSMAIQSYYHIKKASRYLK